MTTKPINVYETWEVLKNLKSSSLNAHEYANSRNGNIILFNNKGRISIKDMTKGHQIINLGVGYLNDTWIKICSPVDFVDAVEGFDKGRDIYCITNGQRFDFVHKPYRGLIDIMKNPVSSHDILNGAWYIK